MPSVTLLLSLAPLILFIFLLVRLNLLISSLAALASGFLILFLAWEMKGEHLISLFSKSGLLSIDILLIILGAILLQNFLKKSGHLEEIESSLLSLTPHRWALAILLVWPLGALIEGIAGFGAPAAILAPLLVHALNFKPQTAIILALVANSTAVTFGAVGTPVIIGFSALPQEAIPSIIQSTSLLNLMAGLCVPVMLNFILVLEEKKRDRIPLFFKRLPWALLAGLSFLFPYYLATFLGPEFPSLLGGLVSLLILSFSLKNGILISKNMKTSFSWVRLLKAFTPFFLGISFLILGKFLLTPIGLRLDLGMGLFHNLGLYNPGIMLLLTTLVLNTGTKKENLYQLLKETLPSLKKTGLILFLLSTLTYLYILSKRMGEQPGLLSTIALALASDHLALYAAFIGALGSFLAGSATVSNLLFAELQWMMALQRELSTTLILAMQLIGAAIGNMISLTNIVAVSAAVGLTSSKESHLFVKLFPFAFIYLFISSLVFFTFFIH